jgi:hypothetical protein
MRPLRAQNELVILPQLPLMIQDNPRSWVKTWVNQWRLPVRIGHLVQDQNIVHRPRSVHHRARADDSVEERASETVRDQWRCQRK